MYVSTILEAKGSDVITLRPHCTLGEASRVLSDNKIGTVVVTEQDSAILGILSERDIVRAVARLGATALDAPFSEHMTRDVKTTRREEPIQAVMEQMTRGRFRHVPVVEGGQMVGIISIGDAVKQRLAQIEAEASAMREYIASA